MFSFEAILLAKLRKRKYAKKGRYILFPLVYVDLMGIKRCKRSLGGVHASKPFIITVLHAQMIYLEVLARRERWNIDMDEGKCCSIKCRSISNKHRRKHA